MGKYIYKLKPGSSFRIGEHESWYSYMASKGLILESTMYRFAYFKKSKPQSLRYRIEVSSKGYYISDEQKSMYEEAGWTYVDSYSSYYNKICFHVFSSPEELNILELHTDPAEQSYTLKELNLNLCKDTFFRVFYIIVMLVLQGLSWSRFEYPWLSLVNLASPIMLILPMIIIFLIVDSINSSIGIRKLKRNLLEGKPINHKADWKVGVLWNRTIALLFSIVCIMLIISFFNPSSKSYVHSSTEEINALPIILLEDIEETKEITRTASSFHRYPEQSNYYEVHNNFFAPINYTSSESAKVKDKPVISPYASYSSSLRSNTYKLRFKSMTHKVFEDILKKQSRYESYIKIINPDFQQLYINELPDGFHIIASCGRNIIFLDYSGDIKIEKALEKVLKLLNKLE